MVQISFQLKIMTKNRFGADKTGEQEAVSSATLNKKATDTGSPSVLFCSLLPAPSNGDVLPAFFEKLPA
jgi:hypothetical protein